MTHVSSDAPVPQDAPGDDSTTISRLKRMPVLREIFGLPEVLAILGLCYAAMAAPFRNADLEVRHILHTVAQPSGVMSMLDSVGRKIVVDTLLYVRTHRFAEASEIWQIQLMNTTSERFEDLDVQLTGVVHVEDSGITTNSSLIQQRARGIRVVEGPEFTARVEGIGELPPRATVELTIWGDFTEHPDPEVKSTANSTRVRHYAAVSGLGAVIDRNRVEIALISGFLALLVGLRRLRKLVGVG